MSVRVTAGDLLASDADAVVCPVNCAGVMGAGLARQFADAYPALEACYRQACHAGRVRPGRMLVWPTGGRGPRLVICFPTKRHWRNRSRLDDIDAGLRDLRAVIDRHDVASLAVPALGCGHGGLHWSLVAPRITAALSGLDRVDVRVHPPGRRATATPARPPRPPAGDGRVPCVGCGTQRHPTVGTAPCQACGTVGWVLAVTGSRTLTDPERVRAAARSGLAELVGRFGCRPRLTLHGDAPGVDRILAARLAAARWPVQAVPADWDRHGRGAGPRRNRILLARADALLAVWDGISQGTRHTITAAQARGLPVACRIIGRHHTRTPHHGRGRHNHGGRRSDHQRSQPTLGLSWDVGDVDPAAGGRRRSGRAGRTLATRDRQPSAQRPRRTPRPMACLSSLITHRHTVRSRSARSSLRIGDASVWSGFRVPHVGCTSRWSITGGDVLVEAC